MTGGEQIVFFKCVCVLVICLFTWRSASAEIYDIAVLQGMDKVTARVSTIEAPVGDTVRFGTLEIIARVCNKKPPEETPESAVFLDIWEVREGESAVDLFRGWMFASSPALSAMEHPVYDVWALDCKNAADVAPSTKEAAPYTPPDDDPAADDSPKEEVMTE